MEKGVTYRACQTFLDEHPEIPISEQLADACVAHPAITATLADPRRS